MLEEVSEKFASNEWGQWLLLDILTLNIRAFLLLAFCYILLRFLKLSASGKHSILFLAAQCLLLLPILLLVLPPLEIVVRITSPIIDSVFPVVPPLVAGSSIVSMVGSSQVDVSYLNMLGVVLYFSVVTFLIGRICIANLKLWFIICCRSQHVNHDYWRAALVGHKRKLKIKREIQIVCTSYISSPATWGFLRPVILIPSYAVQWPDHLIKSTLLHELAHIKRFDWPIQQLTKIICSLYWVNPLVWRLQDAIHGYAEAASDDLAIENGVKASDYAKHLLHVASQMRQHTLTPYAALAMAKKGVCSELKSRVGLILSQEIQRVPISKPYFLLSSVAILGLLLPVTSMKAKYIEQVITKDHSTKPIEKENAPELSGSPIAIPLSTQTIQLQRLEGLEGISIPVPLEGLNQSSVDEPKALVRSNDEVEFYTKEVATSEVFEIVKTTLTQKLRQTNAKESEVVANPRTSNELLKQELATLVNSEKLKANLNNQVEVNLLSGPVRGITSEVAEGARGQLTTTIVGESIADIQQATPTNLVIPKYPDRARAKGVEGEVVVEYALDKLGRVTTAKVVSANPGKYFDKEVLRAIKKSAFEPKRVDGVPVATRGLTEKYVFVLES